jgi:hypothetical protein
MFLSTALSTNMLDVNTGNGTISMPYDFSRGTQHILNINTCLATSRNTNPLTASDAWADTRNETSGAIVIPNSIVLQIPIGSTTFTQNINVNAVQRIIAGTVGSYTWQRGVFQIQVTCDLVRNILQLTPISTTGNFPNATRPTGVQVIMQTTI